MAKLTVLVAAALLGLTLSACRKEGPAEKAGKEIDKAAKDLGQAMEKTADSVKEATKSKNEFTHSRTAGTAHTRTHVESQRDVASPRGWH